MVLNYIWIAFFLIAFVIATVRLVFMGDTEVFPAIMNSTFDTSKTAFARVHTSVSRHPEGSSRHG